MAVVEMDKDREGKVEHRSGRDMKRSEEHRLCGETGGGCRGSWMEH